MFWNYCNRRLIQSVFVRQREKRVSKLRKAFVLRRQTDQGTGKVVLKIETAISVCTRNCNCDDDESLSTWLCVHCSGDDAAISTELRHDYKVPKLQAYEQHNHNLQIFIIQRLAHCSKFFSKSLGYPTRVSWYPKLSAAKSTSWPNKHDWYSCDLLAPSNCPGRTVS